MKRKRATRARAGARGSFFRPCGRAGFGRARAKDYPPVFETAKRTQLLVAVAVNEPVSLHELCFILGICKGAAHAAVAHCERLGIVVRRRVEKPAPCEFLVRGRYCLNRRHPLYRGIRAFLRALDRAKPIGRVKRAGVGALGDVERGRRCSDLDFLFGKPSRTRALAFVALLGVVDARLFTYLWGRTRDTVRKSLESMASARLLHGEKLSGMGRNIAVHGAEGRRAIRRKFKTFRFAESVPALEELRALVNDLARLKPQYGVLADEAKKMRSFLRDGLGLQERPIRSLLRDELDVED